MQATAFSARSNRLAGLPDGGNGSMPWDAATCRTAKRFDAVGRRDLPEGGNGSMPWDAATCRTAETVRCRGAPRLAAWSFALRFRVSKHAWSRNGSIGGVACASCWFPGAGVASTCHRRARCMLRLRLLWGCTAAFLAAAGMRRDRVSSGGRRSRRRIDGTNR